MTINHVMALRGRYETMMNIPVIVMTSEKPAEVQSIKLGADDFIAKPYDMPEVILARCERIIGLYETRSVMKSAERDALTNLYTREFFKEYVRQIDGNESVLAMDAIVLNIEHFHTINELFGRHMGDEVLRKIADMLGPILDGGIWIGCRSKTLKQGKYMTTVKRLRMLLDVRKVQ